MAMTQDPIDWRYLPYIFGLFLRPKFQGIYTQNMALYGTNVAPFFLDPGIPFELDVHFAFRSSIFADDDDDDDGHYDGQPLFLV